MSTSLCEPRSWKNQVSKKDKGNCRYAERNLLDQLPSIQSNVPKLPFLNETIWCPLAKLRGRQLEASKEISPPSRPLCCVLGMPIWVLPCTISGGSCLRPLQSQGFELQSQGSLLHNIIPWSVGKPL